MFNVYLGPSYRYGWRDLEAFCDRDPAVHRAFLERSGIRWLLARARGATTPAEVASRTRICERPLAEIASAVPVDQQRDLVLFRLRTDRRP